MADTQHDEQAENENPVLDRTLEGSPPVSGEEGGLIRKGTGDFDPDAEQGAEPSEGIVVVEDRTGNEFEAPVGADGESAVSPQNPPRKAMIGVTTEGIPPTQTTEESERVEDQEEPEE